jgi:ribosomal protein S18 acetylase RimI-like enzyme
MPRYHQIFFSSTAIDENLRVSQLSRCCNESGIPIFYTTAVCWAESEWPDYGSFAEYVFTHQREFYIVTYASQPIAMFQLSTHELFTHRVHSKILECVYVEKNFRNLGIGRYLISEAKKIASTDESCMLVIKTSNPKTNKLYEKMGAKFVCEDEREISASVLRI